jgi:hypothetical protein
MKMVLDRSAIQLVVYLVLEKVGKIKEDWAVVDRSEYRIVAVVVEESEFDLLICSHYSKKLTLI